MNETALLKLLEKDARMSTCDLADALNESQENAMNWCVIAFSFLSCSMP